MTHGDNGELRQFNSRLPRNVHLILEMCARARGVSMGRLVGDVITVYAIEEAMALVGEEDQLLAEAHARYVQELELIEQLGEVAAWSKPKI